MEEISFKVATKFNTFSHIEAMFRKRDYHYQTMLDAIKDGVLAPMTLINIIDNAIYDKIFRERTHP